MWCCECRRPQVLVSNSTLESCEPVVGAVSRARCGAGARLFPTPGGGWRCGCRGGWGRGEGGSCLMVGASCGEDR